MAEDSGLRDLVLTGSEGELGLQPPEGPWAVVMETGIDEGSYTLVAIFDGSASTYFSNGGGIIGAGEHAAVAEVSKLLVSESANYLDHFVQAESPSARPSPGITVFYVRHGTALLKFEAEEAVLGKGDHIVSDLFYRAHDLITAIRTATPINGD